MINLCLVVIATQFSETKKRETERMAIERARRRRHSRSSSTVTSRASVHGGPTAGCYDELLTLVGYLARLTQRRAARLVRLGRRHGRPTPRTATAEPPPSPPVYTVTRPRKTRRRRRRRSRAGARMMPGEAPYASPELSDVDLTASPRRPQKRPPTTTTASGEVCTTAPTVPRSSCTPGNFNTTSTAFARCCFLC